MCLIDNITPLVMGEEKDDNDSRRQLFEQKVHIAMDNYFSGDEILKYLGERGWKATMTCRRDRLPKDVNRMYFHHLKGQKVDNRSRVARFEQPVIAVKQVIQTEKDKDSGKHDYTLTHVSFQSTGGTNISSVNALSSVSLYVRERNKGRGSGKRRWGIEMNEARETYLKNYSAVDKIDQMLLGWDVTYKSWKWWHAPMRHGKAIALSMAYQLYLQCAEGGVDPEWKVTPVSGPQFCQKLSKQMVTYRPSELYYPGDEKMREATIKKKGMRGKDNDDGVHTVEIDKNTRRVAYDKYLDVKTPARGKKSRLCSGNLALLKEHINSMHTTHAGACKMCGDRTFMKCKLCDAHLCLKSGTSGSSLSCSIDFHDDHLYGLGMMDRVELFNVQRSKFRKPSAREVKENRNYMSELMLRYENDMRGMRM